MTSLFPALVALALAAPTLQSLPVEDGLLVAAPHGGFDLHSDEIARRVALLAGGGYLLASGYRTKERPLNVNRPTEGAGIPADEERHTPAAAAVWQVWRAKLAAGKPRLYVEIHGNSRKASAHQIEVATVGIDAATATRLQADFAFRLQGLDRDAPRLPWAIEPLATLHYSARGAKQWGALGMVPRALHLEIPFAVRNDEKLRGRYADCIASTVAAFVRELDAERP